MVDKVYWTLAPVPVADLFPMVFESHEGWTIGLPRGHRKALECKSRLDN